ncbi:scavenger receptor class B member 1 isoform X1 [Amyelois transitella]|uniref:scavenger receptor class B member 1 isoform X1 n=2 Tax=Amyelois transitella TaxID=680683 RepID=UPI00067D3792|nr:scavenger receptor class B member 1 isoform X1 [Amyelois transitella]
MGHKQYLAVGQSARTRLFGLARDRTVPLNMMISQQGKLNHGRLAVITFSIFTVAIGILLSFVPWLDYIIFRELKIWNGSLSYSYWQKPGVTRLTKVYIFNVTNPQGFLEFGEKPRLVEVGPFVYREDMEKVNIRFHDNDTVTYQHNKILRFVPEMSVDKSQKLVVPNIPLLTVTSFSPNLAGFLFNLLVSGLAITYKDRAKPFVQVTAEELVFGYNDPLVTLAHIFYPKGKRPNSQMGLLLARNGTLDEVSTIYTGQTSMKRFGYLDKINGADHLPHWKDRPCNNIRASEGSFFPPRSVTKEDIVHIYDKDLCRILPLQYRGDVYKDHIQTGLYTPPSSTFECADVNPDNKCYCQDEKCPPRGLQNISPCQYNAPVYLSYPHFYDAEPSLLDDFEGLKPQKKKHETYFMIQPKIGVPLEGFVRVQLNLKVDRAPNIMINNINKFPDIIFPVMWIEEGIHEVTTPIWRWIFLATTFGPVAAPFLSYSMIAFGILTLIICFVRAYKNFVIPQNSIEIVEMGRETIRRGSTLIIHSSQKLLPHKDTSYQLLNPIPSTPNISKAEELEKLQELNVVKKELSQSLDELKSDFVRTNFCDIERESLIRADNSFILSELRRYSLLRISEDL